MKEFYIKKVGKKSADNKKVKIYPDCKQLKGMFLVLKINKVDYAILLINKSVLKSATKISDLQFSQ